jgi:hypothetical protein
MERLPDHDEVEDQRVGAHWGCRSNGGVDLCRRATAVRARVGFADGAASGDAARRGSQARQRHGWKTIARCTCVRRGCTTSAVELAGAQASQAKARRSLRARQPARTEMVLSQGAVEAGPDGVGAGRHARAGGADGRARETAARSCRCCVAAHARAWCTRACCCMLGHCCCFVAWAALGCARHARAVPAAAWREETSGEVPVAAARMRTRRRAEVPVRAVGVVEVHAEERSTGTRTATVRA